MHSDLNMEFFNYKLTTIHCFQLEKSCSIQLWNSTISWDLTKTLNGLESKQTTFPCVRHHLPDHAVEFTIAVPPSSSIAGLQSWMN